MYSTSVVHQVSGLGHLDLGVKHCVFKLLQHTRLPRLETEQPLETLGEFLLRPLPSTAVQGSTPLLMLAAGCWLQVAAVHVV